MNGTADVFNEHFHYFFHHSQLEYNETETITLNDGYTMLHPRKRFFLKSTHHQRYAIFHENDSVF